MFEELIKSYIKRELIKESFTNDSNDICFLTQEDMNRAVDNGVKKLIEKLEKLS